MRAPETGTMRAEAIIIGLTGPAILLGSVGLATLAGVSPVAWLGLDWRLALPWAAMGLLGGSLAASAHIWAYPERYPDRFSGRADR